MLEARQDTVADSEGLIDTQAALWLVATLASSALDMDDVKYPLSVGMQTTAEILLGNRTVAEYLLSPVQKAWHEAGRER